MGFLPTKGHFVSFGDYVSFHETRGQGDGETRGNLLRRHLGGWEISLFIMRQGDKRTGGQGEGILLHLEIPSLIL